MRLPEGQKTERDPRQPRQAITHPDEERFARLGGEYDMGTHRPRAEAGLRQFCDFESRGVRPAEPDPYFLRLVDGKRWWEWTVEQWRGLWGTAEWPGWRAVRFDFRADRRGFAMIFGGIRRRLVPTYRDMLDRQRQEQTRRREAAT